MFNIIKNDILTFFDLYKIINAKTKKEKINAFFRIIFFIILIILFSSTIYMIINPSVEDYKKTELMYLILAQYMAITSSFLIGSNIQKIDDLIFKFKDYNILVSLPIKKSKVLLAKLTTLYIFNLVYTVIFMISPFLIYIQNCEVDTYFYIMYTITLFIIPIVPIIISTILGIFFSYLQTFYKDNKLLNILLTLVMFLVILVITFFILNINEEVETGLEMVKVFNRLYPLTSLYIDLLVFKKISSLILFILIPIILFIIYSFIINKYHTTLYNKINYFNLKEKFTYKKFKKHSQLYALYKKELKRFISSNLYTMNTSIGTVLLTLFTVTYVFFDHKFLDMNIGKNNLLVIIGEYTPLFIAGFILLNASTQSSISLEGKYIGILKSLPISPYKVIFSKILVNITIALPAIIINATLLSLFIKPNYIFYMYYTPIIYLIFITLLGIRLNLKHPKFDYKSELQIIKQSIPSITTLVVGVFIAVMPFSEKLIILPRLYIFIQTRFVEFLTLILIINLLLNIKKLYKKL